jgi:CxxC motif-containing protein (DUF1111 family)
MRFVQMSALALLSSALMITPVLTSSTSTRSTQDAPPSGPTTLAATEAPTGFGATNGLLTATTTPTFAAAQTAFETVEDAANDGLGPVYNDTSCVACHQNPVTGGGSQISEFRAGNTVNGIFTDHPGGSLINDRAVDPSIQEHLLPGNNTTTFRMTIAVLGDGFIEAIDSNDINAVRLAQPAGMRGNLTQVGVLEAGGAPRTGRFGWKAQHASLLSFAADAYLNEMGITNRFFTHENTSNGNSVDAFDPPALREVNGFTEDAEDNDIDLFAAFMRSTAAPPRGPINATVNAGSALFDSVGCSVCHTRNFTTAPTGTVINQGQFPVPAALGNKIIHPFTDSLTHNIGTSDGIVQDGQTVNRLRMKTPALWGLRTRPRLMHDGLSFTFTDAINRHAGEAASVTSSFNALTTTQKNQLLAFLASL